MGRGARCCGAALSSHVPFPLRCSLSQSVDPNLEALATAWEEMSARLTGEQLRVLEERQQVRADCCSRGW